MRRRLLVAAPSLLALAIVILGPLLWYYHRGVIVVFPAGEDRVALMGVFLAAATLAITAVALVVALAAVVGYSAIKDAAEKRAEEAAERLVRFYLSKEGQLPPGSAPPPSGAPPSTGAPGQVRPEEKTV
jgi:ABC-type Fe3+ transport system substrate-binding protein